MMQKILAPTGVLRAALYPGTPTSILEPQAREPRGVGYELGRELARQVGVAYEPAIYAKNADVQDAMKAAKADVAFTNASPARQQLMDFGPPYLLIELGYLVQATSRTCGVRRYRPHQCSCRCGGRQHIREDAVAIVEESQSCQRSDQSGRGRASERRRD